MKKMMLNHNTWTTAAALFMAATLAHAPAAFASGTTNGTTLPALTMTSPPPTMTIATSLATSKDKTPTLGAVGATHEATDYYGFDTGVSIATAKPGACTRSMGTSGTGVITTAVGTNSSGAAANLNGLNGANSGTYSAATPLTAATYNGAGVNASMDAAAAANTWTDYNGAGVSPMITANAAVTCVNCHNSNGAATLIWNGATTWTDYNGTAVNIWTNFGAYNNGASANTWVNYGANLLRTNNVAAAANLWTTFNNNAANLASVNGASANVNTTNNPQVVAAAMNTGPATMNSVILAATTKDRTSMGKNKVQVETVVVHASADKVTGSVIVAPRLRNNTTEGAAFWVHAAAC
jgi:hypothetical protein